MAIQRPAADLLAHSLTDLLTDPCVIEPLRRLAERVAKIISEAVRVTRCLFRNRSGKRTRCDPRFYVLSP